MGKILFAERDGVYVLKFIGEVRLTLGPTIVTFLEKLKASDRFHSVIIDLSETESIDSTALGLIAKIGICTRSQFNSPTTLISPKEDITRVLMSMSLQELCLLVNEPPAENPGCGESGLYELPSEIASEITLREQVLEAHRTLMELSHENHDMFKDLVNALEQEQDQDEEVAPGIRRAV